MAVTSAAVGIFAGKEIFKKTIHELYDFCSDQAKAKIKIVLATKQMDKLYKKIDQVRLVKTIWQVDKAVDLHQFYCDSHLLVGDNRIRIKTLDDLPQGENVVIEGIAGQGKSILLRYLCATELKRGASIAVFVELRRVTKESPLIERIIEHFSHLGFPKDVELFYELAKSGKIILLLDAFDEVRDELKSEVVSSIESLAAGIEAMKIVVTSRPNNDIRCSNFFTVVRLDNLKGTEYSSVVAKLADSKEWADTIVQHVENNAHHVKDLLCTPLMVTL